MNNTVSEHPYRMTISLDVLDHLGVGLYSNVPAVLSESVANAWDADAQHVLINITDDDITIEDDGHGMSVDDANNKYLRVEYKRRKEQGGSTTPLLKRPVMGRKGIGKLSLFSIADTITIYSVKNDHLHGFRMDADNIRNSISNGDSNYYPESLDVQNITLKHGTRIVLSNLRRSSYKPKSLKKRLARRFSVISEQNKFEVLLNGDAITMEDRSYHEKLQYIWTFGEAGREIASMISEVASISRPNIVQVNGSKKCIDGWIGTVEKAGHAKDPDTEESINAICIMVRGKMAREDVLEEFGEGGMYSKYIIGEIHADFLDLDDEDDISTTGRQHIIEEDPRYVALMEKIKLELKTIQSEWTNRRNMDGTKVALNIPAINEWYNDLSAGHRDAAQKLFGRINQLAVDDDRTRRQLLSGGVIMFEMLKFRDLLDLLDDIDTNNLDALGNIFDQLDELEANAYYQITKDRLEVIRKMGCLVDKNALEKAVQQHLFDHLWLLDPSWERATHTERMESGILKAFDEVDAKLTEEQQSARLDIKYTTTGNKHVIVELKRPGRTLNTHDIQGQIRKYHGAVSRVLKDSGFGSQPIEFVCILGKRPSDWVDDEEEQKSRDSLKAYDARIVMYDELINNAQRAYRDYAEKEENVTRLHKLLRRVANDQP